MQSDRDSHGELRSLLETLGPKARADLRAVLIRDDADRDAISMQLMRYRDQNGQGWADIIDLLTMYPEERRRWLGSWARLVPARTLHHRSHRRDRAREARAGPARRLGRLG